MPGSFSGSKYQLRPVKTGFQIFKIIMDRGPDCGLWSASVLIICGPDRLRSGPVTVFFRLRGPDFQTLRETNTYVANP